MPKESYRTSPSRVILSLAAGAIMGALLIALWYVWGTAQTLGIQYVLDYGLRPSSTVFMVALVVWASGLVIFGLPLWWLLHRFGLRNWLVPAAVGGAVTFLVNFAAATRLFELLPPPSNSSYSAGDAGGPTIIDNRLTPHGWWTTFEGSLVIGAGGILVALVIWRIAYRRVDNVPRVPELR